MKDTVQLFYTAPFAPPMREQLQSILSAHHLIAYEAIYDPAHEGLTPAELFKSRNFLFARHPYALIADKRTLTELLWDEPPTVLVVSVHSTSPQEEWDAYTGPGDLTPLQPHVRLALLRALCEERFTLNAHTGMEEWFWAEESKYTYGNRLWQVKTVRADREGAAFAVAAYAVRDPGELHAMFVKQAASTGDVFLGPGR